MRVAEIRMPNVNAIGCSSIVDSVRLTCSEAILSKHCLARTVADVREPRRDHASSVVTSRNWP